MMLRTTPPRVMTREEAYAKVPYMTRLHVNSIASGKPLL